MILPTDDKLLFVADWLGVARVDVASTRGRNALEAQAYFRRWTRRNVLLQRKSGWYSEPGSASRPSYALLLEFKHGPNRAFEVPTTATLVDGSMYFMANTQVDRLSAHESMPLPATLHDIVVLRLNL